MAGGVAWGVACGVAWGVAWGEGDAVWEAWGGEAAWEVAWGAGDSVFGDNLGLFWGLNFLVTFWSEEYSGIRWPWMFASSARFAIYSLITFFFGLYWFRSFLSCLFKLLKLNIRLINIVCFNSCFHWRHKISLS